MTSKTATRLIPREHGAYTQLGFPLLTILLVGGTSGAALAFAGAAIVTFFAYEPMMVLLGHRGARARRERRSQALEGLWSLEISALTFFTVAVVLAPRLALAVFAVPAVVGAVTLWLVWRGAHHSMAGELLAALGLCSWALPVGIAAGATVELTVVVWATWSLAFGLGTVTVRRFVQSRKAGPALLIGPAVLAVVIMVSSVAAAVTLPSVPMAAPLALLPACCLTLAVWRLRPHTRHLRKVGWALAASSTVTALVLVVGLTWQG